MSGGRDGHARAVARQLLKGMARTISRLELFSLLFTTCRAREVEALHHVVTSNMAPNSLRYGAVYINALAVLVMVYTTGTSGGYRGTQ